MTLILHVCTVWTNSSTKLLIDVVHANMYDAEDEKVICHSGIWRRVQEVMTLNGYSFTSEQLRGRWKTLVSSYKRIKDSNCKSGEGTRKHPYMSNLSFLDKSADVVPAVVVESTQVPHPHSSSDEDNQPKTLTHTHTNTNAKQSKKTKTVRQTVIEHLHDMSSSFQYQQKLNRDQKERHHVEKIAMIERVLTELKNKKENKLVYCYAAELRLGGNVSVG